VRLVKHGKTGQKAAAKIIPKAVAEKSRAISLANLIKNTEGEKSLRPGGKLIPFGLEREIVIMKLLDHPNIVRLYDVWENSNELYLIMEYVEGGELFKYIHEHGKLEEIEVVHLFRQIIAALLYCHRIRIHHRDLKPENILLDREAFQIKLVDFGMAALQPEGTKLSTPCGSPHYAAPEVIGGKAYDGGMADVWSCGVILFIMLTGLPPFNPSTRCRDGGMRDLFYLIRGAKYEMPETICEEAKDLIRRILVVDINHRIRITDIWKHPFLHKYDKELGFKIDSTSLDSWIGPTPNVNDWKPLTRETIDREILRNMRALWHSVNEEDIVERLLEKYPNQEKFFYSAISKHVQECLETYDDASMEYSASDYHHSRPPLSNTHQLKIPLNKIQRSDSEFSIRDDEHLYSKHTFHDSQSDHSYDPFRASREPVIPETSSHINVTVHRYSRSGSNSLRPVTALGNRQSSSLRIHALKNANNLSSNRLVPHSKQNSPAHSQRSVATGVVKSGSRSTLSSAAWASSPPIIASTAYKRQVSFTHLRGGGVRAAASTNGSDGPGYSPEHQKFLDAEHDFDAPSSTGSARPATQLSYSSPPRIHHMKTRDPQSSEKFIEKEARKASSELEKVMDDVFNGSIISSDDIPSATLKNRVPLEFETPPSSFSNRNFSSGTPNAVSMQHRPLPALPKETSEAFTKRRVARIREEIFALFPNGDEGSNEQARKLLRQLDQLVSNTNGTGMRASSAPVKSSDNAAALPIISEEGKLSNKDGGERHDYFSTGYRAFTDPVRPNLSSRRAATEQTTIRVAEKLSDDIYIAPLNIRKRSGASTNSSSYNTDGGRTVPGQGPTQPTTVRAFRPVHEDKLTALPQIPVISQPEQPAAAEKTYTPTLNKKKSSWFQRLKVQKEPHRENEQLPEQVHNVPDVWKGLDAQFQDCLVSGAPPKSPLANTTRENSDTSSEFPMRQRDSGGKGPGLKGFLGLFGKKSKEKCKKTRFIPHSELPLYDFDLADEDSPSRAGKPVNWLSRFLHIRPATKALCLRGDRKLILQWFMGQFRAWRPFGIHKLCKKGKIAIELSVSRHNVLNMKPIALVVEVFVVMHNGQEFGSCIARFTQTSGAASSFNKVVELVEDKCREMRFLIEDKDLCASMLTVLSPN
jgi:serine/threonine protein kinase